MLDLKLAVLGTCWQVEIKMEDRGLRGNSLHLVVLDGEMLRIGL
jgi:hypothetical protein